VDAYSNKTQWGEASPTELFLETANLPGLLARDELGRLRSAETLEGYHLPARLNLRSLLMENALGIAEAAQRGVFASLADFYRERLDEPSVVRRFVVQCWLAARARALHARWLGELETREPKLLPEGFASEFTRSIAAGWSQVSAFAYVLLRKIEQGKPPILTPFALIDALANREGSAARAVSALLGAE